MKRKRAWATVSLMLDPLVLAGFDALSDRRKQSRQRCLQDALYTALYGELREGRPMRSAPILPYEYELEGAQVRVVDKKLANVDQFGLPVEET